MIESAAQLYEAEWTFRDWKSPPRLGVSLSGGGNRSAAFSIGVLRALHERGLLQQVDVVSAVSGGSYALSWLMLQPLYYATTVDPDTPLKQVYDRMFNLEGEFQTYLQENAKPLGTASLDGLVLEGTLTAVFDVLYFNLLRPLVWVLSFVNGPQAAANLLNASSAREGYRKGIQKTYQVLPDAAGKALNTSRNFCERVREATDHLDLSDVTPVTFPAMAAFAKQRRQPCFVFNTTVRPPHPNARVPLAHRIFELTPVGFGSDSCGYTTWEETEGAGWEPGRAREARAGWRQPFDLREPSPFATIRSFNMAPAFSGAALSGTNLGGSWRARFALRLANLGLEYVVPRPGDRRRGVLLSDGGHSENLGAYGLLRRKCRRILIVDAEHDKDYKFESWEKLKTAAAEPPLSLDLCIGATDPSNLEPVRKGRATSRQDGSTQEIYYLKLSMDKRLLGEHRDTIEAYAARHRAFPQETTVDQYFEPAQFKAYRELGYQLP